MLAVLWFREAAVRSRSYLSDVKVLGIDPGTAACGYGIVHENDGRLKALVHGAWRTPARAPLARRLGTIFAGVEELVEEHRPDAVALEESFVGVDARTALSVGQARGAVLVACARAGVEAAEYAPNRIKQMVCGYGHADKGQVQRMVKAILGLSELPRPDHAADALAVAICHALAPPLLRAVS
jgi:crossover junction endodeoxyribonuclease RuvC